MQMYNACSAISAQVPQVPFPGSLSGWCGYSDRGAVCIFSRILDFGWFTISRVHSLLLRQHLPGTNQGSRSVWSPTPHCISVHSIQTGQQGQLQPHLLHIHRQSNYVGAICRFHELHALHPVCPPLYWMLWGNWSTKGPGTFHNRTSWGVQEGVQKGVLSTSVLDVLVFHRRGLKQHFTRDYKRCPKRCPQRRHKKASNKESRKCPKRCAD